MSTHNICFCGEIKKNISTFWLKERALSGAMNIVTIFTVNQPSTNRVFY